VLRSIPSLLSYSRTPSSFPRMLGVAVVAIFVPLAMLLATVPINAVLGAAFGRLDRTPGFIMFLADWTDAAIFGALLAAIVRTGGVRVAFGAAVFLVLCFALPALLGFPSSQAPFIAWVLLGGTVPAMCFGAAAYQIVMRRERRRA
jgi:hypothetical protein